MIVDEVYVPRRRNEGTECSPKGFPAKRNQREPMIGKPEPKAKLERSEKVKPKAKL